MGDDEEPGWKKRLAYVGAVTAVVTAVIGGGTLAVNIYNASKDVPPPVVISSSVPTINPNAPDEFDLDSARNAEPLPDFVLQARQRGVGTTYGLDQEVRVVGTGEIFVRLHYRNPGPDVSRVHMKVAIPPELSVDLRRVRILDARNLNGAIIANVQPSSLGFETDLGSFTKGSNALIAFNAELRDADTLKCGDNTLVLRGTFQDSKQNRTDSTNEVRVIYNTGPCAPRSP